MEQLLGHDDAYEQCEGNETQKEKEKSNEKEIVLAAYLLPNGNDIISEDIFRKNTFPKNDDMLTEHYVNVPELPPKA